MNSSSFPSSRALRSVTIMRLYHMRTAMSLPPKHKRSQSRRAWLSGVAVTLCTIIAYFAFWHLAPVATFLIGCAALVGIAVAVWVAGGEG